MNKNPHPHLVLGCIACHYQNEAGSSVHYDYKDRGDRKRALSQLDKKRLAGTIDFKAMVKAVKKYKEIQAKELDDYIELLKSNNN